MPELPARLRELMETCSSRRMLTSIAALIVYAKDLDTFCVLIVMIEEIAEESEMSGDFGVKRATVDAKHNEKDLSKIDETCWEREAVEVLQACIKCTDFERKAIKSKHCVSTGYFDRLRCKPSGSLSFRPCNPGPSSHSLLVFCFVSVLTAVVSGVIAVQRKAYLDRYAYTRVLQTVN